MLKFNKPVDQEQQGLEEGEISGDDNLQQPATLALPRPQTKHIPIPDQQQQESPEYVVEQVKIKAPSPPPDRKKERKDLRPDDKNLRQENKFRGSHSPEGYYQPPAPIQHSSYFNYPNSNNFYPPPNIIDPRQHRYPNSNMPAQSAIPPQNMGYQTNHYQERPNMQGQWGAQIVSPHKTPIQAGYGYPMNNNFQNSFQNQQSNYYKPNSIPYQPPYHQSQYPPSYPSQFPNQPTQVYQQNHSQPAHSFQHQQYPQTLPSYQQHEQKMMEDRKKQQEELQSTRERNKRIKEIETKITDLVTNGSEKNKEKENDDKNGKRRRSSVGVDSEQDVERVQIEMSGLLKMVKKIIKQESSDKVQEQQNLIEKLYRKIEESKLKQKMYAVLTILQLTQLVDKLKEKQLEDSLIGSERKNEARQIYKIMGVKSSPAVKQAQTQTPGQQLQPRRDPRPNRSSNGAN